MDIIVFSLKIEFEFKNYSKDSKSGVSLMTKGKRISNNTKFSNKKSGKGQEFFDKSGKDKNKHKNKDKTKGRKKKRRRSYFLEKLDT